MMALFHRYSFFKIMPASLRNALSYMNTYMVSGVSALLKSIYAPFMISILACLRQSHTDLGNLLRCGIKYLSIYLSILLLTVSTHRPFVNFSSRADLIKSFAAPLVSPNLLPLTAILYLAGCWNIACCFGKFCMGSSI